MVLVVVVLRTSLVIHLKCTRPFIRPSVRVTVLLILLFDKNSSTRMTGAERSQGKLACLIHARKQIEAILLEVSAPQTRIFCGKLPKSL